MGSHSQAGLTTATGTTSDYTAHEHETPAKRLAGFIDRHTWRDDLVNVHRHTWQLRTRTRAPRQK